MPRIRPFEPSDLDTLYVISLETGHEGGDASHLYADKKLIGHIYSAPYALLEPECALVVEDADGVAGFAVGALDTVMWHQRLEREWWPSLRSVYEDPGDTPLPSWSADQRRTFVIHHPAPPPRLVVENYPAHLHLNLRPRIQGKGVGRLIFLEWLFNATRRGAERFHVGANRANLRAIEFWARQGFELLPNSAKEATNTVWMGRS